MNRAWLTSCMPLVSLRYMRKPISQRSHGSSSEEVAIRGSISGPGSAFIFTSRKHLNNGFGTFGCHSDPTDQVRNVLKPKWTDFWFSFSYHCNGLVSNSHTINKKHQININAHFRLGEWRATCTHLFLRKKRPQILFHGHSGILIGLADKTAAILHILHINST